MRRKRTLQLLLKTDIEKIIYYKNSIQQMRIPLVDLKTNYLSVQDEVEEKVGAILTSGSYILGENVEAFEQEVSQYIGARHSVAVNSGTDALHLALLSAGIKPGDEVITTPFTFAATVEAIVYVGAVPVFADVEKETFNLDVSRISDSLTEKTCAILPVHLFGHPARIDEIMDFAIINNLKVIEDCAQSFGAHFRSKYTGTFGDAGCFSFFPTKNLGCFGDGGLVTTNSYKIAEALRMYRNHGISKPYCHDVIGYNSRLDEIQAGILRVKLKMIDSYNLLRRNLACRYTQHLGELPMVQVPVELDEYGHVYNHYTIVSPSRDKIRNALASAGIASAIYYPLPLHLQKTFSYLGYREGDLPRAENLAKSVLSLPIYPELGIDKVDEICATIMACFCK